MSTIKRLVLDVLKPHQPSIIVMAERISSLPGVEGVNSVLEEVDQDTMSVKVTIEGSNLNYEEVREVIESCGATVHSIDAVAAGRKIVEEVETPQDR